MNKKLNKKKVTTKEIEALFTRLKERFEKNMHRHKGIKWKEVEARLRAHPERLYTLYLMEETGGDPDVVAFDKKEGAYTFYDCSPESPKGRRSLCYDSAALKARKEHPPKDSAMHMAEAMGVSILTEEEYRRLQKLGKFDMATSSWVRTPPEIRKLGGAVFCDRRYEQVFLYHNSAESYYASRGFRGSVRI